MSNKKPLLSIVIPTKNREEVAIRTIRSVVNMIDFNQDEIEVVVQDCSQEPRLKDLLRRNQLNDIVSYYYVSGKISMTNNWNYALENANGEYIIFIGDDDSVASDIKSAAEWARGNNWNAVMCDRFSTYYHSDFADKDIAGMMFVPNYTGKYKVLNDAEDLLQKSVRKGGGAFHKLPKIYHNIIKREVLQKVYKKVGSYFDSAAPDVYSSFAIGCIIGPFVTIDYPLSIIGASGASNTNRVATGDINKHFSDYDITTFSELSPKSNKMDALLGDSMLCALTNLGRGDLIRMTNLSRIYARTILEEPNKAIGHIKKYASVSKSLTKHNIVLSLIKLLCLIVMNSAIKILKMYGPLANRSRKLKQSYKGVVNILEAIKIQDNMLASKNVIRPWKSASL